MDIFNNLIIKHNINLPPIINIYAYGSINYGTFIEGKSDYDYIVIFDMSEPNIEFKIEELNINGFSEDKFMSEMTNGNIAILEALHKPLCETKKIEISFDLSKLRNYVSEKSDVSYVKAKKKLIIEHDIYIAKKSLFHSLRMLKYGTELAKTNKITDWNMRELYDEIMSLPEEPNELSWNTWNEKYKKTFNQLKSEFKKYAPKLQTPNNH
jgi:hypothetical protein